MAKQIIVRPPLGHGLEVDYAAGTVHAVSKNAEGDEYLVITPKPGAADPTSAPTEAGADKADGFSYPLPPVIMSFRTKDALQVELTSTLRTEAPGPLKLSEVAERLAGLEEDETQVMVVGPSHGG